MWWLALIGLLVVTWLFFAYYLRRKDLRATAVVDLRPDAPPSVTLWSKGGSAEDLVRLGMTYGSKLRWVLVAEPSAIQEQFSALTAEIRDAWPLERGSLIDNMPTGRAIRDLEGRPLAVPGGERFAIRYARTSYRTFRNKSSVVNSLPRPGLASNLLWNYVVLMDAIHRKTDSATRKRASRALDLWWDRTFGGTLDTSLHGLKRLITEADYAWELSGGAQSQRRGS